MNTSHWVRSSGFGDLENTLERNAKHFVLAVVCLAVAARLCVAFLYADIDPRTANIWEYGRIARLTLENGHMVYAAMRPDGSSFIYPTAFMPPLPIFVWIAVFGVFGVSKIALAVMVSINVICGTAIVFYTIRIGRLLFRSWLIALGAAVIIALYPTFVFSAATYHALNLYILLLLAVFDLCLSVERYTVRSSALAGVLVGLAALTRTEYLILAGAGLIGALLTHRRWKLTAVAVLCAVLLLLPWTARNYVVFGKLIPVANSTGLNLFKGFNPEANGSGDWVDKNGVASRQLGERLAKVAFDEDYESAKDQIFRDAAVAFVKENPFESFIGLPAKKLFLFWFFDVYDPFAYHVMYQLTFWPILFLTIVGLFTAWRSGILRQPTHRTVMIFFAFQCVVMASYAVHMRYRMNVEPFLFIYASYGAVALWRHILARLTSIHALIVAVFSSK